MTKSRPPPRMSRPWRPIPIDCADAIVEAKGIRFAYSRFGKAGGCLSVFNQHYTAPGLLGTPGDGWLGSRPRSDLFNNAGVSSSSGEVRPRSSRWAPNAVAFIRALVDQSRCARLSIGGMSRRKHAAGARSRPQAESSWAPVRAAVREWVV